MATLVLGGARSGKSRFAEELVAGYGVEDFVYFATAEAGDAEMAARIDRHRARRGAAWRTVEEPLALTETLKQQAAPGRAVLVDCLTLWLSNLMHAGRDWRAEATTLAAALPRVSSPLVLVSNEVGLGLVPETELGRAFRDAQGALNQMIAAACDTVIFVTAGLPIALKGKFPT